MRAVAIAHQGFAHDLALIHEVKYEAILLPVYPVYLPSKLILSPALMLLIHSFLHLALKVFYDLLYKFPSLRRLFALELPPVSHTYRADLCQVINWERQASSQLYAKQGDSVGERYLSRQQALYVLSEPSRKEVFVIVTVCSKSAATWTKHTCKMMHTVMSDAARVPCASLASRVRPAESQQSDAL